MENEEIEVPLYVQATLLMISRTLENVQMNLTGKDYDNPFVNTGNRFECETFKVHAYDWSDDSSQTWNFKWKDFEVRWYKHANRGLSMNRQISADECADMLQECLVALQKYEEENPDGEDD